MDIETRKCKDEIEIYVEGYFLTAIPLEEVSKEALEIINERG